MKVFENSHIGKWVFVKGGCRVSGNVPPFIILAHNPAVYYGVNATIMRHKDNFNEEEIDDVAKAYRHIYDFIKKNDNKIVALPKLDMY